MNVQNSPYLIEIKPHIDHRGSFTKIFPGDSLSAFIPKIEQVNLATLIGVGTTKGFHMQITPKQESKLIYCVEGSVCDLALDLRAGSVTFGKVFTFTLSAEDTNAVLIPEGFAHAIQSLTTVASVIYLHSSDWSPDHESGVSVLSTELVDFFPIRPTNLSERDEKLEKLEQFRRECDGR